ncbi:3-phenylpropionate/cinnamic acid dioxygenase subunit beta [Bacillus sp. OK048]|uniref:3-phenylpropionate/cinnamic acid dioxygenase subunit beta n=1 Tax=Bacillus sp. OK048 TaxID=1882761 RepID=UPI00087EFF18|nr:3-phenylpropionate/cinnamic acid dioxygenase subunit beta [Bacillus sp. OK048]SDL97906.1 3-phenylpropionate/cinnamic acid dioxygenase, small subunit [Bacillus sp. OK048]
MSNDVLKQSLNVSLEIQNEIRNFLYHEVYLLNHFRYKEWLDLLSDDIDYQMPMRITPERGTSSAFVDKGFLQETKKSLTFRVDRLYQDTAWTENPATRQRHFINNIFIQPCTQKDEYQVRSYFLFRRNRASDSYSEELSGERVDVIRKENGDWKIASRMIYSDQSVLGVANLGMFL